MHFAVISTERTIVSKLPSSSHDIYLSENVNFYDVVILFIVYLNAELVIAVRKIRHTIDQLLIINFEARICLNAFVGTTMKGTGKSEMNPLDEWQHQRIFVAANSEIADF
jgi:uncharacterized membrane protein